MTTRKTALDMVLDHLEEVLRLTRDGKLPDKPLPKDINKQVDELERVVSEFTQLSERLLKELGVSEQESQRVMREGPKHLSDGDARTLKRSSSLLSEARQKYAKLGFIIEAAKRRGDIDLGKGKKATGQARKKKFRRVGGKRTWMPM